MPFTTVVTDINHEVAAYGPAAMVAIQAAEVAGPNASGQSKFDVVMEALGAGSAALEGVPDPNIAGIAALVNMSVMIFNALGKFKHKQPDETVKVTQTVAVAHV